MDMDYWFRKRYLTFNMVAINGFLPLKQIVHVSR
jgi:hypothetical protein